MTIRFLHAGAAAAAGALLLLATTGCPVTVRAAVTTAGPMVAYRSGGEVLVLRAGETTVRAASPTERSRFRRSFRAVLDPISPGGRYRVVQRRGSAAPLIVRHPAGTDARVDVGAHSSMDGDRVVFDGWLDPYRFAVWLDGMAPDGGTLARRIMDVRVASPAPRPETGPGGPTRRSEFNGWLGPGGRTAIVLHGQSIKWTVDGRPVRVDPAYAGERTRFLFLADGPPRVEEPPPIPILAVLSPVRQADFRLSAARTVPLTLAGRPFEGLQRLSPDFAADPVARRPTVEFSRDGLWALAHKPVVAGRGWVEYLISLESGAVHRLPGSGASFL
jgi:hypothetical protein